VNHLLVASNSVGLEWPSLPLLTVLSRNPEVQPQVLRLPSVAQDDRYFYKKARAKAHVNATATAKTNAKATAGPSTALVAKSAPYSAQRLSVDVEKGIKSYR
jgi:hypothetical protein